MAVHGQGGLHVSGQGLASSHGNVGHAGDRLPKITPRKITLINKFTAMMQAFRQDVDMPENLVVPGPTEQLSRTGTRHPQQHAFAIFGIRHDYHSAVRDCTKLGETNPVFSPIIRKLTRTVSDAETRVVFEDAVQISEEITVDPQVARAKEIVRNLLTRISWDDKKEEFVRTMLNEGGLSLEVVTSSKEDRVDRVEYRPHQSIFPLSDRQGSFIDPKLSYVQRDGLGKTIASFALWQMVDVNLEESSFHNRGVPHLQTARQLLQYTGLMTKGLMQKWIRESGSIEHFNLEEARKWSEVDKFREVNEDMLNASPENLVRQLFTRGKVNIERLVADNNSQDTKAIEFMLDLIFLAAGVPREIVGFKSNVLIKDMIDVAVDNYYQQLQKIQKRLFVALRKVINFELLINGIIPEDFPFTIQGGKFEVLRQVKKIPKEAIAEGAVSVNDIRRAINLPALIHPMWDIPGLYNDPITARAIAKLSGIELPFEEDEEFEEEDAANEDEKNRQQNKKDKDEADDRKSKRNDADKDKREDDKEFGTSPGQGSADSTTTDADHPATTAADFPSPPTLAKRKKPASRESFSSCVEKKMARGLTKSEAQKLCRAQRDSAASKAVKGRKVNDRFIRIERVQGTSSTNTYEKILAMYGSDADD